MSRFARGLFRHGSFRPGSFHPRVVSPLFSGWFRPYLFKNDVSAILFFSPVQVGEDITHQEQFIHNVSLTIPLTH